MSEDRFDLESGALCLDFANTAEWHASEKPEDRLVDVRDLLAWGEAAGVLDPVQVRRLTQLARERPDEAAAAHARAIVLREAIYRLFAAYAEDDTVDDVDLAALNEVLQGAQPHLKLVPTEAGFGWDWVKDEIGFERIIWPVARSAAELMTSTLLKRVSQCADDRGCGYLFVDMSRNKSRRWCSMESCGNRAKARRHYQRQQET